MHDEYQPGYNWEDLFEKDLENGIPPEDEFFNREDEPPDNLEDWNDHP